MIHFFIELHNIDPVAAFQAIIIVKNINYYFENWVYLLNANIKSISSNVRNRKCQYLCFNGGSKNKKSSQKEIHKY